MSPPTFPYYYLFLCSLNYKIKSNKRYGTGIKTYVDKWKTTEEQNLSTYNYSVLIFDKDSKNTLWRKGRKDGVFNR